MNKPEEIQAKIDDLRQMWGTPDPFYNILNDEVGGFDIDVAADEHNTKCRHYLSDHKSGLRNKWFWRDPTDFDVLKAWCNPPYRQPLPWVGQAVFQTNQRAGSVAYMLLNHDHSTKWYGQCVQHASEIRLLTGARIQYVHRAKDWDFSDFVEYLGLFVDGSPNDYTGLPVDIKKIVDLGWTAIQKARKSTNSKAQCLIVFRKKQPEAPCHVWHWDWQKSIETNKENRNG